MIFLEKIYKDINIQNSDLTKHCMIMGEDFHLSRVLSKMMAKPQGIICIEGNDIQMENHILKQMAITNNFKIIDLNNPNNEYFFDLFNQQNNLNLKNELEDFFFNNENVDFFVQQAKMILDISMDMVSFVKQQHNIDMNIDVLSKALSLEAYLINLVPESTTNYQKPNEDIIKLNNFEESTPFWIPNDYINPNILDNQTKSLKQRIIDYINGYNGQIRLNEGSHINNSLLQNQHQYSVNLFTTTLMYMKKYIKFDFNENAKLFDLNTIIQQQEKCLIILPYIANNYEKIKLNKFFLTLLQKTLLSDLTRNNNNNPSLLILNNMESSFEDNTTFHNMLMRARAFNIGCIYNMKSWNRLELDKMLLDGILFNTYTKIFFETIDEKSKEVLAYFLNKQGYKEEEIYQFIKYIQKVPNINNDNANGLLLDYKKCEKISI